MALTLTPADDARPEPQPERARQGAAEQQQATADPLAEARRIADAIMAGDMPPADGELVQVLLQPRHAEYLRERAAAHGETPEKHLESILRQFRATDDWRLRDTRPREPGQPAGSGRR